MIRVSCAIIQQTGKILAAQRSALMSNPLKWEFPGGKIELEESPEHCLLREIKEELGIEISVLQRLIPVTYSYPNFDIELHPFLCEIRNGTILLKEHLAFAWFEPRELEALDFSAADVPVLKQFLSLI